MRVSTVFVSAVLAIPGEFVRTAATEHQRP